ncbi:FHA domain-containing protein [Arthrobacter zhangbolii]|uniref:FHA domain-containing protein n=1 Tax=Arthrobacter zhangbolii TaxID=2886936 RepID=A0A9X1SAK2_9MICC|nr:FtsK/SpoIIIE domain-containing protein [Arthrobacter zhangbolii]MCC3273641.1 FHA domain-containing protein [Arthrobacter zhangbolii]UON92446.1 FHA domain-containing protein [Arthrobacter zhangbolii]
MRLLIDLDERRFECEVAHAAPSTTLADLVETAGGPRLAPDEAVFLNESEVSGSTPVSELVLLEGSRIARTPWPSTPRVRGWSVTLAGGKSAGSVTSVPQGREMLIGRSPHADLTLPAESASWDHCRLRREEDGLRVLDSGSTNGTLVNGEPVGEEGILVEDTATVTAGGTVLLLRRSLDETPAPAPGSLHNLTPAATAPFNRPPRPGQAPAGDALVPPTRKDVPPASKFSYITVLAPLVMAGVMVAVLGDMRFAMFAMLSPVMAVGMWFEQKRRHTRGLKDEDERFTGAIQEFEQQIRTAAEAETARRHRMIPDPATVVRRPALPATSLWQRRADADDFLALHAGTGDVPWKPEVDRAASSRLDEKVKESLAAARLLAAPVLVDLTDAGVVGIVGPREGALALARSLLVQAAVHVGPADLTVGVFCDAGRAEEWEWASWLPHTRQAGSSNGQRWMSSHRETSVAMLRALKDTVEELPTPALLVVLDSEVLTEGRDAPARALLGMGRSAPGAHVNPKDRPSRAAGIVIATSEEQLPASCTSIIRVGEDSAATLDQPEDLTRVEDVILAGLDHEEALRCAMRVAHFDDPELNVPGASLPPLVRLPDLLGYSQPDAPAIRRLWDAPTGISAPIGTGEDGALSLDLVKDGPHGLVGGTTGSGKSEFLRSFVAGLAARNDPTRLNFILIDFKGGAAFKACERLPHTIGTISNLDEQLADRALQALEAEMERRQRVFAAAGEGIDNLPAYMATNPAEPMPRLLLVIDEFAMLAKDFPDVLQALVSVGAVGRTLGVHMILATQRPAGVVNDDILANTNLRVALRVQSREDSNNVIGVPDASAIGRAQMGRAYVKLGQDDITPVQTALVTGRAQIGGGPAVDVREIGPFGVPVPPPAPPRSAVADENDLDLLIDAIVEANADAGYAPPRPVWPEALGERVELAGFLPQTGNDPAGTEPGATERGETEGSDDVAPDGTTTATPTDPAVPAVGGVEGSSVLVTLMDEPELQRQSPSGWDMNAGNLMLLGVAGSGTTTTLASIALTLASSTDPADLDLMILDMGSRELEVLKDLPHTVAYVGTGAGAKEQQARFLRHLHTEMEARRADPSRKSRTVVLLDGLASLRDEFQDYEGQQLLDLLYRAYADGPALGLSFAVSTTRAKAVPTAMNEVTLQRWLFRLADTYDYSSLGIRGKAIPAPLPGRCVDPRNTLQMHVATPAVGIAAAVERVRQIWGDVPAKAPAIRRLPSDITLEELGARPQLEGEPWLIPVGMQEADFSPAFLEIYEGEHALIAGPARSGKSTLLLALAGALRGAVTPQGPAQVWGICDRRSPLASADLDRVAVGTDEVPALLASLRLERGPVFLLIDDAERFEDADQSIGGVVASGQAGLCVIAAGRSADLRGLYSHWTKTVRKSRLGVLLQPDVDYDGELLGGMLPRKAPVAITTGRGYIGIGGRMALIQSISAGVGS